MNPTKFLLAAVLALLCALPPAVRAVDEATSTGRLVRTVHFRHEMIELDPSGAAVLDMLADDYARAQPAHVVVVGYAAPDEGRMRAGAAYAQGISERRAGSVRNYLYRHGVPLSRIQVRGRGLALPAEGGENPSRRSVEIFFE